MLKKVVIVCGVLVGSVLAAWGASNTLSGLNSGTAISGTDLFYDVQTTGVGGVKVTGSQFLNFVYGNVSGACTATPNGVFTCNSSSTGTVAIAAGSNISTSGTSMNVTVNVISTPTFTSISSTLASISGWLTAPGINASTITISSFGGSTQCVESVNGILTGTGTTCGTGQFSVAAGTNITTSGTANNITVNVVATPTFTNLTTTLGAVSGWLTASGVNMQTATVAGNLTATTAQVVGWLTAPGANFQTITIGGSIVTKVRTATTTTASATTDYFLCLDPTSALVTLTLPASPLTGLTYLVKDCTGQAATHNIIVTGTNANIDGAGSFTLSTNYQSIGLTYNGTQWSVN